MVLDLLVDLVTMCSDIGPGVHEILGTQSRVVGQKVSLARAESAVLLQEPDGDPGPNDARIAALHTRDALDAGEDLTDVSDENLEELGLLGRGHLCNQRLCRLEGSH